MDEEPGGLECNICGGEICCEPPEAALHTKSSFICQVCGRLVTVEGGTSSPPSCCGKKMAPYSEKLW